jgi:transposase-like protein
LASTYSELPFQVLAILSDGENTLMAALKACWPQAPRQRCQAHFLNTLTEAVLDYDDQLRKNMRQDLGWLQGVPEHTLDTLLL